jgi:hypothetical protein
MNLPSAFRQPNQSAGAEHLCIIRMGKQSKYHLSRHYSLGVEVDSDRFVQAYSHSAPSNDSCASNAPVVVEALRL